MDNLKRFLLSHLYLSIALGLLVGVFCFYQTKPNITTPMNTLMKWTGFGGYCTDWAYSRWKEVHPSEELKVNGNAWEWYGYALNHGMSTGTMPQVGSVVVWDKYVGGAADVGHVAFVEQVYSGSSFRVSEMNWGCGRYCRSERNVNMVSGIHFIYPQQQLVQCNEHDRCKGTGPNVYFIERGKKRYIGNSQTLEILNQRYGGGVKVISDDLLNSFSIGRNTPDVNWPNTHDNVLIKGSSAGVYVMKTGKRRLISDMDQIDLDGDFYYPSDIRTISNTELNGISNGAPIYNEGNLFSESGRLHVIEKGKSRYIPTPQTYSSRGYASKKVFNISTELFLMIPKGRQVPDVNWPNTHDNVLIREGVLGDIWLMRNGMRNKLKSLNDIDPVDGDSYYESDIRQVASVQEIPIQNLELPLSLSMAKVYWASRTDYDARELSVDYIIKNTGVNDAYNVTVTGSSNNKSVTTLTALPQVIGDILASEEKKITIRYYIPVNTPRFRANLTATAEDFNEYLHTYPEPK